MIPLPPAFLTTPLAHRALHDVTDGRPENSRAAIQAAIAAGYGIEVDVQPSLDGVAMVFHDYDLARLTGENGPIAQRMAKDLRHIGLRHGGEAIPTLVDVLSIVAGQVPLLIEIKDQDGAMGANVGRLEQSVADALASYKGHVAVMSFNPHSVALMAELAPNVARGLTTCAFSAGDWPLLNTTTRTLLSRIPDFDRTGSSFVSHDRTDLRAAPVMALKARNVPILCWTIRSPEAETQAREIADNVTFEGYLPATSG